MLSLRQKSKRLIVLFHRYLLSKNIPIWLDIAYFSRKVGRLCNTSGKDTFVPRNSLNLSFWITFILVISSPDQPNSLMTTLGKSGSGKSGKTEQALHWLFPSRDTGNQKSCSLIGQFIFYFELFSIWPYPRPSREKTSFQKNIFLGEKLILNWITLALKTIALITL